MTTENNGNGTTETAATAETVAVPAVAETPKPNESAVPATVVVAKVTKPRTKRAAPAATQKLGLPEEQRPKTVEEAVSLYNEMVQTVVDLGKKNIAVVKTFVDLKTGQIACDRLHNEIVRSREPKKEVKVAKKAKTAKAAKKAAPKAKTKAKKTANSGKKSTRLQLTDETKFVHTGEPNPFREKSGRWTRTERVIEYTKTAQTWKALRTRKVRSGTMRKLTQMGVVKVVA